MVHHHGVWKLLQHEHDLCSHERRCWKALQLPSDQLSIVSLAKGCVLCVQGDEAYAAKLFTYATSQINYMLGDAGRSYVVGFGKDPPTTPFHKW